MSLPCSVIRDLLPLYAEDVMEEENKTLVEDHLEACADCKKALEELQEPKPVAAVSDTVPLQLMKHMLRRHTRLWCLLTGCLIAAMAFTLMGRMTAPETAPYVKGLFSIEQGADGLLSVTVTDQAAPGVDFSVEYFTNEQGLESMCISAYTSPWLRAAKLNRAGTVYAARSDAIRHVYYCDHSRGGKLTLLHGPTAGTNHNGGILLLPRLALNRYFFAALALTGLFSLVWLFFRKKAAGPTVLSAALGFGSYAVAHLLIKGSNGATYFLLQDLAFILLTAAALFGIGCAALSLHRLQH